MARGDALYSRIDVDIWFTRKMLNVKPAGAKSFYLFIWTLSTKERSSFLDRDFVLKLAMIALGISKKTAEAYEKTCLKAQIISLDDQGRLFITGAKDCHARINWKDDGKPSPQGEPTIPHTSPVLSPTRAEEQKNERRTDNQGGAQKGNLGADPGKFVAAAIHKRMTAIQDMANDIIEGFGIDESSKPTVMRILEQNDHSLCRDAFLIVKDRIQQHKEGIGEAVLQPLALMRFHLKRLGGK